MEAQTNSRFEALAKFAATYDPAALGTSTLRRRYTQQTAAKNMAQLILMSLGLGVGTAGLRGLKNVFSPRKLPYKPQPFAQEIDVPVPAEDEKEKLAAFDISKLSPTQLQAGPWKNGITDAMGKAIFRVFDPGQHPQSGLMRWLGGSEAKPGHTSTVPFSTGVGLPLAVLAGLGGFGLTDKLISARRRREKEQELEEAKARHGAMLREGFPKTSADEMLDDLADMSEKQALGLGPLSGTIGGPMMAYAALAALLSGKLSYDYFKGRGEEDITEEAIRQRAKERAGGGMLPAYITTTPQPAA